MKCRHVFPGEGLYCKKCKLYIAGRAKIFIDGAANMRNLNISVKFSDDGMTTVTLIGNYSAAEIENFRAHLVTLIKPTKLVIN
ncbi:MAG: hypothetical protein WC227_03490 [Patescibacteria group bacterium]|jgi:hypothetical protein